MQGTLYDMTRQADLGEEAMKGLRVELLRTIPVKDRIVFAPPKPKYTVTVFTDVECGYCRKMHGEIAEYNRQGIAVQRSEEHTAELQSLMRSSYAVFCLKHN